MGEDMMFISVRKVAKKRGFLRENAVFGAENGAKGGVCSY
jgi:hypothetical protein